MSRAQLAHAEKWLVLTLDSTSSDVILRLNTTACMVAVWAVQWHRCAMPRPQQPGA